MSTGASYPIGEPGRSASELPAGPPPARVGPADVELSSASLPGMIIRAASSRGLEHRATGTVRQDAFALAERSDRLVAVVCDGVGSLPLSDVAAVFASRRLAVLGAEGVPWAEAFAQVNFALRELAEETVSRTGASGDKMATTAVALVVYREGIEWVGDVAWVGDSVLWHLDSESRWTLLTRRADQEAGSGYHSTGVTSLPSAEARVATSALRLTGGALFAMSDGVANPLDWSDDVRDTLACWWAVPPDPFTFAAQVGFARKSHLDDRTVVGIWPDGGDSHAGREGAGREAGDRQTGLLG